MAQELPNPFRAPPGPSRRAPAPPGPREWGRLYILALAFLLVMAAVIGFRRLGSGPPPPPPPEVTLSLGAQETSPPAGPATPFREMAAPFRDGMETLDREAPEFRSVVERLRDSATAGAVSRAVDPALTADGAYRDAARLRGAALRTRGRLLMLAPEPVKGLGEVPFGVLQEDRSGRTVTFYLPAAPLDAGGRPLAFRKVREEGQEFIADWVEIEGVFLRQYDYPSRHQDRAGETVWARTPLLFAVTLRKAAAPERVDQRGAMATAAGVALAALLAIGILAWVLSRREGGGSLRMRMFMMKKQAFPAPDPGREILGDEIPRPPAR